MDQATRQFVLELLAQHNNLSLATVREDGYPQATTVAYVNDGLTLYVGASAAAQKVGNIRRNPRVSLTIDRDYPDWNQIKGLSLSGTATIVEDENERARVYRLMQDKFPPLATMPMPEDLSQVSVIQITPKFISVLNYEKGFGHSELFEL